MGWIPTVIRPKSSRIAAASAAALVAAIGPDSSQIAAKIWPKRGCNRRYDCDHILAEFRLRSSHISIAIGPKFDRDQVGIRRRPQSGWNQCRPDHTRILIGSRSAGDGRARENGNAGVQWRTRCVFSVAHPNKPVYLHILECLAALRNIKSKILFTANDFKY